jgi:uncharacterized membrane protein
MTARGGLGRLVHALRHAPWYPVRIIGAHPRLFVCLAIGICSYFLLPETARLISRLLISWNLATISFLASIALMMSQATPDTIRRNAALYDEGQNAILGLASVASIACLTAIIIQLGLVKESTGLLKAFHLSLALVTILTAWAFIHVMFALHYAHEYFDEWRQDNKSKPQLRGGLEILGSDTHPDYLDFAYYAFTIAVANATADINITSREMRRITLVHSVLSFFFNLALLGLTINIAASLI